MSQPSPKTRLRAFDTLRFLAAAIVFFVHTHVMTPWLDVVPQPLRSLIDAKGAVAFFFVLSGYVLHLSWKGLWPRLRDWLGFVVRRLWRIYPLYYVSLLLALVVVTALPLVGCPMFHDDASGSLVLEADRHNAKQWLLHALLIVPGIHTHFLNPPIWTLVAEMQMSLIFPWISWLARRSAGVKGIVVLALMLAFIPGIAARTFGTLALIPIFFGGALLAENRNAIKPLLTPARGMALLASGLVLFGAPGQFRELAEAVRLYAAAGGAALIMTSVLALPRLRALLEWRWLALGGDASYGLYALHFPILMAAAWAAWHWSLPVWLFVGVSFAASLALAVLLYRALELPCILFARGLASRITGQHDAARAPQSVRD